MSTPRALVALALAALGILGCNPPTAPGAPVAGQVACQGVPEVVCRQAVDTTGAVTNTIAKVLVRCTLPVCTVESGEANVTVFFVDGRQESSNYGWSAAQPVPVQPVPAPPALTVEPVCVEVPLQMCMEMASSGSEGDGVTKAVGSITVRCTAVCTATHGEGQTTFEYIDRTPSVTADWIYENSN